MLHRTHELRVLSEVIDKYFDFETPPVKTVTADIDGVQLADFEYSRDAFFAADPGTLDPDAEADALPPELIRKLRGDTA